MTVRIVLPRSAFICALHSVTTDAWLSIGTLTNNMRLVSAGINCGVLLIRNTDWAREFFADVAQYAFMPKAELMSTMRPVRMSPQIDARYICLNPQRLHQRWQRGLSTLPGAGLIGPNDNISCPSSMSRLTKPFTE